MFEHYSAVFGAHRHNGGTTTSEIKGPKLRHCRSVDVLRLIPCAHMSANLVLHLVNQAAACGTVVIGNGTTFRFI